MKDNESVKLIPLVLEAVPHPIRSDDALTKGVILEFRDHPVAPRHLREVAHGSVEPTDPVAA